MVVKKLKVFKTNLIKTKNYVIKRNKLKLKNGEIIRGYTVYCIHPDNKSKISRNFLTQASALKWARLMTKVKGLIKGRVMINYNDIKSIKKAEIKHLKLINDGLVVYQTTQKGLNVFENTYI